jgi:hypothetical protein
LEQPYTPHTDQRTAIDFILKHKAVLIKGGVGSGKTLVGVQAALEAGVETLLVIGPLNTWKGWRTTTERQSEGARELRWINSRKAGQEALQDLMTGVPGWYFIGRELFRNYSWRKVTLDMVIWDEIHGISNRKSKSFKITKTAKATYKLGLSATPAGNHLSGMWSVSTWLWPTKTLRSYWSWITQYFMTEPDPYSDFNPKVTIEREPGKMWAELPAAYKMKSVYTAEPVIHEIEVDISPVQRKHYRELEEEALTWLKGHPLAIDVPAVLHTRLRQVCLAVPSVKQDWIKRKDKETGLWEDVWGDVVWFDEDAKSTKIDALLEILGDLYVEKPVPVLVFTDSRKFATITTKRLQAKGYRARQFIGGMSDAERFWKLDNFGKEYDVLVAVISAIGTGTDGLQDVCNTEVWMNFGWNGIENEQGFGRLSRQGQTKTVQRFIIQARDTVETRQREKLRSDQELLSIGYRDKETV